MGDCSTKWQFTHMAGTQAQMVIENAVFGGDRKVGRGASLLFTVCCQWLHALLPPLSLSPRLSTPRRHAEQAWTPATRW